VLTKPLGAGAVTTAHKRGAASAAELAGAVEVMAALNDRAARQVLASGAHAATDVTGFGLLGHLRSLTRESGVSARVIAEHVPILDGALELLSGDDGAVGISGGLRRNSAYVEPFTTFAPHVSEERRRLLCDPMTSGGLLVAVERDACAEIDGSVIGEITAGEPGSILVV
jgi:selenide,water dikinase